MSDLNNKPNVSEDEQFSLPPETSQVTEASASESEQSPTVLSSPKRGSDFFKEALEYIEIFVFAVCLVILMFSFVFRICTVNGSSMENTLLETENLIVSDFFYTPERGDIVVFHQTGEMNEPIVKRVIATEGETVKLLYRDDTMQVTITDVNGNSTVLEEDYMKYEGYPLYRSPMTFTVPEGCLFVMGDNRNESKDSRHSHIGFVDERRVLGKVLFRISPFERMGIVE